MKQLALLFLFIGLNFQAQTNRFVYEFKYKKDSLSDKMENKEMFLDINTKHVLFYEAWAVKIDSINRIMGGVSQYTFPFAKLKRDLSSSKNMNHFMIGDSYFQFETDENIDWKITPETKTKEEWNLQKATTNFVGRAWEAWFTTDIPISEGPYKFVGLPGLIVELRDTKDNFSYDLVRVEKPANANPDIVEMLFKKKPIKISLKKYQELLISHYNDPYSRFRQMKPGSWSIGRSDDTFVDTIEGLAKITKEEQEEIRKNNNPIELDKAIRYSE